MTAICQKCGHAKVLPGIPIPANAKLCSCKAPETMPIQVPVRARKADEMKPRQFVTSDRLELLEQIARISQEIADVEDKIFVLNENRQELVERLLETP